MACRGMVYITFLLGPATGAGSPKSNLGVYPGTFPAEYSARAIVPVAHRSATARCAVFCELRVSAASVAMETRAIPSVLVKASSTIASRNGIDAGRIAAAALRNHAESVSASMRSASIAGDQSATACRFLHKVYPGLATCANRTPRHKCGRSIDGTNASQTNRDLP